MTHRRLPWSLSFLTDCLLLLNTYFWYSLSVYFGGDCADLFCMQPPCAMFSWSLCSLPLAFGSIVLTLLGGAIRLHLVWLLPNKRNLWECLVCFDESAYVITCNVRSVLLMLSAPGARIHTEWWGIFDLQPPEVSVLFDYFIISLFFLYGDTVMIKCISPVVLRTFDLSLRVSCSCCGRPGWYRGVWYSQPRCCNFGEIYCCYLSYKDFQVLFEWGWKASSRGRPLRLQGLLQV